jgi:pimeloyl-ACP methyl ester carboxylesterase
MLRSLLTSLLLLIATGCAKLPPNLEPDDTLTYRTEDGWQIGIRHYPGPGETVLLVHGMAANHFNWDYRRELSLAAVLQDDGWDVWVPEMRGDPSGVAPSRRAARSFNFDDYARKDLPAAVDAVLAATGKDALYWVGHSMGGILLYTALTQYPEKIAAGVAISSPATLEKKKPIYRLVKHGGWLLLGPGLMPNRLFARSGMWLGRLNPFLRFVTEGDNVDMALLRGMAHTTIVDLPLALGRQVNQWIRADGIVSTDGTPWVNANETPILVIAGGADRIVPAENVLAACDIFPNCESVLLSRERGFSIDYGHIDPVVAEEAKREVYPLVTGFLDTQRAKRTLETHQLLRATARAETSQSEAKPTQSSPAK